MLVSPRIVWPTVASAAHRRRHGTIPRRVPDLPPWLTGCPRRSTIRPMCRLGGHRRWLAALAGAGGPIPTVRSSPSAMDRAGDRSRRTAHTLPRLPTSRQPDALYHAPRRHQPLPALAYSRGHAHVPDDWGPQRAVVGLRGRPDHPGAARSFVRVDDGHAVLRALTLRHVTLTMSAWVGALSTAPAAPSVRADLTRAAMSSSSQNLAGESKRLR